MMVDNNTASDVQKALEKQVADLRSELKRLTKSVSERSGELRERSDEVFDDASGRVRSAAASVKERGQAMAETVRENPGTATTIFGTAGILGILIGIVIGCLISERR